jgi:pyridoxamine 5'-phosphate oxidase
MPGKEPTLDVEDLDPDPYRQFDAWFQEALGAKLTEPTAMTLATASREGRPSARTVLLKGFDQRGFVFYTNYGSRKARELTENPHAALVLHWAPLRRQVCIAGGVSRVSRAAAEAYFRTRPRESQLGAWASRQSEVVESRRVLDQRLAELEARYRDREVPLPPFWGGFRLVPDTIEFWQGREGRLHDRLRYRRDDAGRWVIERLSP